MEIIDRNIVELLKGGDMTAFDLVYRKYCSKLFGFVLHIIKTESDAEEIVQEVFVKLWESRHKLEAHRSFDSYLFTIAYNTTISLIRKRITDKKYIDHILLMQHDISAPDSVDELQFEQLNEQLNQLIDQLPSRQKEVFRLNRTNGMTYKEIASHLNISENTVENHMVKALRYLKGKIQKESLLSFLFLSLFL